MLRAEPAKFSLISLKFTSILDFFFVRKEGNKFTANKLCSEPVTSLTCSNTVDIFMGSECRPRKNVVDLIPSNTSKNSTWSSFDLVR